MEIYNQARPRSRCNSVMNLTVTRHVNWMKITNRASAGQRRRRRIERKTVAFDERGVNGCVNGCGGGGLKVQRCAEMYVTRKGLHTKGARETDCTCTGWLPSPFSRRRYARTLHELVNRRGAAREHSVFGRHNANASIILDDRRLISYCREGRRARAGIISGWDVASRSKFRNFAK